MLTEARILIISFHSDDLALCRMSGYIHCERRNTCTEMDSGTLMKLFT